MSLTLSISKTWQKIFLITLLSLLVIGGVGLGLLREWAVLGAYSAVIALILFGGLVGWKQETDQDHR